MYERRDFLKGLAAVGSGSMLRCGTAFAQERRAFKFTSTGGAIDVHHHMRPNLPGAGGAPSPWAPQQSIEADG